MTQPGSIHPETSLGPVHLTISNLDRSVAFYRDVIGLGLLRRQDKTALLAADGATSLVILTESPGARPKPPRTTGLYHFAILLPTRLDLARSLRRLVEVHYQLQGASDHLVSEALYLADPDGNGIEIYADRPRSAWPRINDLLQMATEPLDLEGLLGELERDARPWDGLSPQTRIGHIHLHVADLRQGEAFYRGAIGFDLVLRYGGSATFLSAGGYHHHIGLNTWAGAGAPPPPPEAVGLRSFTIVLPDDRELQRVIGRLRESGIVFGESGDAMTLRDPSGNGLLLVVGRESLAGAGTDPGGGGGS